MLFDTLSAPATAGALTGFERNAMEYIFDQTAGETAKQPLGRSNVGRGGCGAVATFNALVTMGKTPCLEQIIRRYRRRFGLRMFGWAGISLWSVADFFASSGYAVKLCADPRKFNRVVRENDAGIFWYLWLNGKNRKHPVGAHYIHAAFRDGCFRCYNLHRGQTGAVETDDLRKLMKQEAVCALLLGIREKVKDS